jgi:hypothetical protein
MLGDTEIENVRTISKDELLAFYDRYINPCSPHRSVLSVHVKSQVAHQSPDLQQQLAEGIRLFLAQEGFDIPASEVAEAVKTDVGRIPQEILALIIKHGYDRELAVKSMAKGSAMLEAQIAANNASATGTQTPFKVLNEVKIDDIRKFQATLTVGDKPMPIQPLETFYESHSPKL